MNFKMTIYPAIEAGNQSIEFLYETAEQMVMAKDTAARLLLFMQDQAKVMEDYSNLFLLEEKAGNEWEEYEEF